MADAERDFRREAKTERLLRAPEVLLHSRAERQRRANGVDASPHKPARRKRLRTLHVPAGRGPRAETRIQIVVYPLACEAGVAEGQFGFDRNEVRVAILGDSRALARTQPPAARQRRTDAETDKRR